MSNAALHPAAAPGDPDELRKVLTAAGRLIVGKPETLRLALT